MKPRSSLILKTLDRFALSALALALLLLIAGSKWWREVSWGRTVITEDVRRRESWGLWVADGSVVYLQATFEWDEVGWNRSTWRTRVPPTVDSAAALAPVRPLRRFAGAAGLPLVPRAALRRARRVPGVRV